jgi:hypothetical protein
VSSAVTTATLLVFSMKMHSYFAYVAKEYSPSTMFVSYKKHARTQDITLDEYVYFCVAPTLCFFRYYPRTKSIRLGVVLQNLVMLLVSLLVMYAIV